VTECERARAQAHDGPPPPDRIAEWLAALDGRHLERLTPAEAARALRALSSAYIERRGRLAQGAALDGAGKRAAFALFYTPLHFLTVSEIVRRLGAVEGADRLFDLGCGCGAAGAGWALARRAAPRLYGVDRSPWAAAETNWTWRTLGLVGHARRGDLSRWRPPAGVTDVIAAWTVNELDREARETLLDKLLGVAQRGGRVLIVEPLAASITPWWADWQAEAEGLGGRADLWRIAVELPERVRALDRAAGLDHRELTARSLAIGG
jgi:hypothetical protein